MKRIDSFAYGKPEGQHFHKSDGKVRFQCINRSCDNFGEMVEAKMSYEESYLKKIQKLCECGHTRSMHDNSFSRYGEFEPISNGKKDVECHASNPNNCECKVYTPKESKEYCGKCGEARDVEDSTSECQSCGDNMPALDYNPFPDNTSK